MKLADFKELLDSNANMNVAIDPFVAKLDITQKEIQALDAMKSFNQM